MANLTQAWNTVGASLPQGWTLMGRLAFERVDALMATGRVGVGRCIMALRLADRGIGRRMSDDELLDLERRGWQALSGPDGAAFYDALLSDDALMVFPMGVFDRAASLSAIRGAAPWRAFHLAEVRIARPAPDVGVVTYSATATRGGGTDYQAWMTSVYVRARDGNWRLALHQQSPG